MCYNPDCLLLHFVPILDNNDFLNLLSSLQPTLKCAIFSFSGTGMGPLQGSEARQVSQVLRRRVLASLHDSP
jgi:hypothetical protein